jgi:methylenetetrahydrofolate reductase (NADPH)
MAMPVALVPHNTAQELKVSFEFFPASSEAGETELLNVARRLEGLSPDFVSVTYGAGGTTRERTLSTIRILKHNTELEIASHLTCCDASRDEIAGVVEELGKLGIDRIVALRGDPAGGIGNEFVEAKDGYGNAAELVGGLRKLGDFDITVSAYPEKHPESPDIGLDVELLKRKVDNGASRAITQYFFENDLFETYLEKVRAAGINIPIIPGILPIHHFTKVAGFSRRCGASIPEWLSERFDGLDADPQTRSLVAAATSAEQVFDLTRRGVSEFHFYTMNKSELPVAICRLLGLREKVPGGAIAA